MNIFFSVIKCGLYKCIARKRNFLKKTRYIKDLPSDFLYSLFFVHEGIFDNSVNAISDTLKLREVNNQTAASPLAYKCPR